MRWLYVRSLWSPVTALCMRAGGGGGRSCVYVGGCCREGEEAFVLVPRCVVLVKKLLEAFLHWEYSGQGCRNITLSAGDVKNPLTGSSPPSPPPTPPPSTRLTQRLRRSTLLGPSHSCNLRHLPRESCWFVLVETFLC